MRMRFLGRAMVPLAGAALALITATSAFAITAPVHVVADGSAGYELLSGTAWHTAGAILVPNAPFANVGGVGLGGGGSQLCDPNNGRADQVGLTTNGSTETVEWAVGTLAGQHPLCEKNGVLAGPHVLSADLAGLPIGDVIYVWQRFRNVWVPVWDADHDQIIGFTPQGRATFQAYDATQGIGPLTVYVHTAADFNMDSAGWGLQQDTTLTSLCPTLLSESGYPGGGKSGACNDVMDFFGAQANTTGIFAFNGSSVSASVPNTVLQQVVNTVGGLSPNPANVAPNNSLSGGGDFSVFAGNAV